MRKKHQCKCNCLTYTHSHLCVIARVVSVTVKSTTLQDLTHYILYPYTRSTGRQRLRALTKEVHHGCHGLLKLLELQCELDQHLAVSRGLFPTPPEVTYCHLRHEIAGVELKPFEGILLVVPALVALHL